MVALCTLTGTKTSGFFTCNRHDNRGCGCARRNLPLSWALPGCAWEATTGPGFGFVLTFGLLYYKVSLFVLFFFNLPLQTKKHWSWEAGEHFSYAPCSLKDTTSFWGGRERISCLLITVRERTHSEDLIYFQTYWQSLNSNDGMKSNHRWVMKGQ